MESVEDHGFLVDIGINGSNAFLPKKGTSSKQGEKSFTQIQVCMQHGFCITLMLSVLYIHLRSKGGTVCLEPDRGSEE